MILILEQLLSDDCDIDFVDDLTEDFDYSVPTIQLCCVRWIIILHCLNCFQVGWNSVVNTVTRYGLDSWGIEF